MKNINDYISEGIFDIDDETIVNKSTEIFDLHIEPEDEKRLEKIDITTEDCYTLCTYIVDSCKDKHKLKGETFDISADVKRNYICVSLSGKGVRIGVEFRGKGNVMYWGWGINDNYIYDRLSRGKKPKWLLKFTRHKQIIA